MRHNDKVETQRLTEGSDLQVSLPIVGEVDADGSVVTCLAVQNVSGTVKQLSTSVTINVLCK